MCEGLPVGSKICNKCGFEWTDPMDFCINCRVNLNPYFQLDSSLYEHPADRAALNALKKMKPFNMLVRMVIDKLMVPWMNAQYLGSGVKVTHKQFPELYKLEIEAAKTLAVPRLPKMYVVYSPYMNAFTIGTNEDPVIVLFSAIIDEMSEDELKAVIGHEMGHIKSNHVLYHTVGQILGSVATSALSGIPFANYLTGGVRIALLAWMRKSEYTADRAALLVSGNLEAVRNALIKLQLGSRKLFDKLDMEEYMEQLQELDEEKIGKWSELFLTHPFGVRRVENLNKFYENPVFKELRTKIEKFLRGEYVPEEVEEEEYEEVPEEIEVVTEMRFCPHCGAKVRPGSKFCTNCGAKLR